MGLEGGEGVVTAADLNADTLAAALAAAAPACLEVYRRRGKQLSFGADEDVTSRIQDPRWEGLGRAQRHTASEWEEPRRRRRRGAEGPRLRPNMPHCARVSLQGLDGHASQV